MWDRRKRPYYGGDFPAKQRRWHGDDGKVERKRWRRRVRYNANIKNLAWARRRFELWVAKITESGVDRWKIDRSDFLVIANMVKAMGYTKLGMAMASCAAKNVDIESNGRLMFADLSDLERLGKIKPFGKESLPDNLC